VFVSDIDEALPLVVADREKISAVLENLVINAIKFTPEGGRIAVRAVRAPLGGRPGAEVRVEDTGIGIPADQIEAVFAEFRQVDATTTRDFGGTGLGLSITKKFVELHGGRIWVESEVGKGSTFYFEVPLRVEAGARA
jgi:signal transduction histidine kinase